MSCAIWGCSNTTTSIKNSSVHFYYFPKDLATAKKWVSVCGRPPEQINIPTAQLCSIHFSDDSYITKMKKIENFECYVKLLKSDAVPTLFLPIKQESSEVQDPLNVPTAEELNNEELNDLRSNNEQLKKKLAKTNKSIRTVSRNLNQMMELYKKVDLEVSQMHQKYLQCKGVYLSVQKQKQLLTKVFSDSQIKILCGKKKIYWSDDDMAVAHTIRHLGNKRCYGYLAKRLKIPLPVFSSIKRWLNGKGKGVTGEATTKSDNEESE